MRIDAETNAKGGVHSEEPNVNNKYNQNFRNRFCGCECDYDPFQQKGTMFQCLGLGTHETGGCGEDWWHPGCVVGLGPKWFEGMTTKKVKVEAKDVEANGQLPTIAEDSEAAPQNGETGAGEAEAEDDDDDPPPPPGFPADEEFESFLCYKCVDAHPWIKRYAGTPGFLPPVYLKQGDAAQETAPAVTKEESPVASNGDSSKKRKAEDDEADSETAKRQRSEVGTPPKPTVEEASDAPTSPTSTTTPVCKLPTLPAAPSSQFSLFLTPTFRTHLCHCPACFPLLTPHPQLLEEEETYEPPTSEDGDSEHGASTDGGSLYDRGESALRNVDRVRAIEGVMAYQHLKDKLMPFFQEFAASGKVVSAEDVKEYFAKLRGDEQGVKQEGGEVKGDEGGLREGQSGY